MATYDNPRTGVVHWTVNRTKPCLGLACVRFVATACGFLNDLLPSWNQRNFDPVGEPVDVTCCHCRERAAFLEASQKAFDAAGGLTR
jgi:hypothetical protein